MDCPMVQKGCIDPIDYPRPQYQLERVRLSIIINISYMRDPTCNVSLFFLFFFFFFFSFISVMSLLYMNETINQRLILVFFFSPTKNPNKFRVFMCRLQFLHYSYISSYMKNLTIERTSKFLPIDREIFPLTIARWSPY